MATWITACSLPRQLKLSMRGPQLECAEIPCQVLTLVQKMATHRLFLEQNVYMLHASRVSDGNLRGWLAAGNCCYPVDK